MLVMTRDIGVRSVLGVRIELGERGKLGVRGKLPTRRVQRVGEKKACRREMRVS